MMNLTGGTIRFLDKAPNRTACFRPRFYLRWIAAAIVLCIGLYLDMRPAALTSYPFTMEDVATGARIDSSLEWRDIPAGSLPEWPGTVSGFAVVDLAAGTPLLPALVTTSAIPDGWWAVPVPLPHRVPPGTPVRVALGEVVVDGMTVGEPDDSGFEIVGSVAFPATDAAQVAMAASTSALVVMIGAGTFEPGSTG